VRTCAFRTITTNTGDKPKGHVTSDKQRSRNSKKKVKRVAYDKLNFGECSQDSRLAGDQQKLQTLIRPPENATQTHDDTPTIETGNSNDVAFFSLSMHVCCSAVYSG